jgi:hypothetical protein
LMNIRYTTDDSIVSMPRGRLSCGTHRICG